MDTKQIKTVSVNDSTFCNIAVFIYKKRIDDICMWFDAEFKKSPLLKIKNQNAYFFKDVDGIIPMFSKVDLSSGSSEYYYDESNLTKLYDYKCKLVTEAELQCIISNEQNSPPTDRYYCCDGNWYGYYNIPFEAEYAMNRSGTEFVGGNGFFPTIRQIDIRTVYNIPIYRLGRKNRFGIKENQAVYQLLEQNIIPDGMTEKLEKTYKALMPALKAINNDMEVQDENLRAFIYDVIQKKETDIIAAELLKIKNAEFAYGNENTVIKQLLECDKIRCDISPYDEKLLTDPSRGHWDLWDGNQDKGEINVTFDKSIMARNPAADIVKDGMIGIDFGTKSTVVAYQGDRNISYLMTIGKGNIKKKITKEYYENPTVMEFRNLENFLNNYKDKNGRPLTKWEDVTTSHTANENLINSSSEYYNAYLDELKQWAGDSKRHLRLRDKQGKDYTLPSFLSIKDGEFNPIELYAYYIGLNINNMNQGIYLDYLLSFPVTYEKEIREKILESFRAGIKKSLPVSIQDDDELMKNFRVRQGVSEPEAYAAAALEEFGFDPDDEEKILYGVFDFGGGTTDFDFGLYEGSESRRYDYTLTGVGSGGDKYLGGENLLELMAFEVFKMNSDMMLANGYKFTMPPESMEFNGSVALIDNNSQEAKLNNRKLVEALRGYWEKPSGYENKYTNGIIKVMLSNGSEAKSEDIHFDKNKLDEIISSRIERGIINFFERLKTIYSDYKVQDKEQVNIFLAGNSSKAEIVRELFKKYMLKETNAINQASEIDVPSEITAPGADDKFLCKTDYFILYPPLGEDNIIEESNNEPKAKTAAKIMPDKIEVSQPEEDYIRKVTGKTGVAFGLIKCRPGGKIKVVENLKQDGEISFRYYIGYEKKKRFITLTDTSIEYNQWYEFDEAVETDNEIYYSSRPDVTTNKISTEDVHRKKYNIQSVYEGAYIYYRAISPSEIEVCTATEDDIKKEIYLEQPVKLVLDE